MEAMEIFLAAVRDLSYVVVNYPVYSVAGSFVLTIGLMRFYCKLTAGICDSDQDMTGKTVLITGATAGIGRATAEDMARRNAHVILACRNMEKANRAADEIIASTGNKNVIVKHLDLSSLSTVRKCAEDVLNTEENLHVLINNAGIFWSEKQKTEDGFETVWQSNYLGHFLLTLLLLDLLKKSAPCRIVNVASSAYKYGKIDLNDMDGKNLKSAMEFYSRSKLANVLFSMELASRLANSGVTVNAVVPGLVNTDIIMSPYIFHLLVKFGMYCVGKTCEEGAQTTIYAAVHPVCEKLTGKYFEDCREVQLPRQIIDKILAKKLFEATEEMVGTSFQKS